MDSDDEIFYSEISEIKDIFRSGDISSDSSSSSSDDDVGVGGCGSAVIPLPAENILRVATPPNTPPRKRSPSPPMNVSGSSRVVVRILLELSGSF